MEDRRITIIGLGLIGGSLAKALKEKAGAGSLKAISRNRNALEKAKSDGIILEGYTGLCDEAIDADIIFICTPLDITIKYIDALSGTVNPGCLISDVCSVKGEITKHVNEMNNPSRFIGGHPMAGSEKTGYMHSVPHLFENAYYVLTPCKTTTKQDTELMVKTIRAIGGIPVVLDADTHDRATAAISHVPHLVASALVNLVHDCDDEGIMRLLAAGGFKDITRIASSDPGMWGSIITGNSSQVIDMLEKYQSIIRDILQSIAKGNTESIMRFFTQARDFRNEFKLGAKGLIEPAYKIVIDVADKPGIIGKIATLLGSSGINIKNINVSNSREMEDGCLRITLTDEKSLLSAIGLLHENDYRVHRI